MLGKWATEEGFSFFPCALTLPEEHVLQEAGSEGKGREETSWSEKDKTSAPAITSQPPAASNVEVWVGGGSSVGNFTELSHPTVTELGLGT